MAEIEGSELVARALKAQGVDHVFTVVGGPVIEAVGYCGDLGVRPVGVRHEQAAVIMAEGYGYVGGKVGAALVASGPAVTNAITGVHVAWDNCLPVIVLGGSSSQRQRGMMPFQEADSVAMMRPVTKWAVQVDTASRIPEIIAAGFRKAMAGRPGPVYIDLPSDVLSAKLDDAGLPAARPGARDPRPQGDPAAIRQAAQLLLNALRPLMLLGKGVRWSNANGRLAGLVEALGLPFLPSPMGRGFIPDDHPLCVSGARSHAMRNADVVLVIGARLNWMFGMGRAFPPDAQIIQVDIDPSEIGLQREAAVGICGDAGLVVSRLLAEIAGKAEAVAAARIEGSWLNDLRAQCERNEKSLEAVMNSDAVPMTHHRLLKEVRDAVPRDTIFSVDGQIVLSAGRQVLPTYFPASRLNSGSNGCMGVGIPFAIGAKLAAPGRPVVSINGDSAFGFNGMEMETSIRAGAPVVFVVDNNEGIMGGILNGRMFKSGFSERVAMYQPGIRYDKIIEAFGGYGEHVERPEDIRPALERAFACGTSACIDIRVDPSAIFPVPTAGRASSLMGY